MVQEFEKIPAMGFNIDFGNNSIQEVVLNKRKVMVSLKIGERKYMPSWPTCLHPSLVLLMKRLSWNECLLNKIWQFIQ